MPWKWIAAFALLAALFAGTERLFPAASGEEGYLERLKPGHCPCAEGQACWHYLRSPLKPPTDKCRCGCCLAGGSCETKDRPKGTSGLCWGSAKEECFWKRHAYSWHLQCSECWTNEECAACDGDLGGRDTERVELGEGRIEQLTRDRTVEACDGECDSAV